jgi:hyperosmotically inducible protein
MEIASEAARPRAFGYLQWCGSSFGLDLDDWLRAERESIWYPDAEMTENDREMRIGRVRRCALLGVSVMLAVRAVAWAQDKLKDRDRSPGTRIAREVRHELIKLPYYGVFDNLAFRVEGGTVTLLGQVTSPTLKNDAKGVVKQIEGIRNVKNEIEVLPLSPDDGRIRIAAHRAIYSQPVLNRYALRAVPPIHNIVKNRNLTLEGFVANQEDRNIAAIQANGVAGVFPYPIACGSSRDCGPLPEIVRRCYE